MKTDLLLTSDEEQVYEYIVKYTRNNLFPPTVAEIKEGCHMNSTSTVYCIIGRLETKEKLKIKRDTPRGIKLIGYELVKA